LLEIVTEPDLKSAEEVRAFASALRSLLRYLGVNSGDLEKGVLRVEPNVSVRPVGTNRFGTRVEIKNLNSFRALERSVAYEIERQIAVIKQGQPVRQETVGWDDDVEVTFTQRVKEGEDDYRYFPEPDLPPLVVEPEWIERVRNALPELPHAKFHRLRQQYGLSEYDADVLTQTQALAGYYERVAAKAPDAKIAANWVMVELLGALNGAGLEITASPVSAEHLAELVGLIHDGTISGKMAKSVFEQMFATSKSARQVVGEQGLQQITDDTLIREVVRKVVDANPKQLQQYKAGKTALFGFFVGQVMKETKGQANPAKVNELLKAELERA